MKNNLLIVMFAFVGCSSGTHGPGDAGPPDYGQIRGFEDPILEPRAYLAELPERVAVPGGPVMAGDWYWDGSTFVTDCAAGSYKVLVGPFRLMATEVSGAAWKACMDAGVCVGPDGFLDEDPLGGRWNDPVHLRKPVAVSYPKARAFCRAFGGDLPTLGQWLRAAQGDGASIGVEALTARRIACAHGADDPFCSELTRSSFGFQAEGRPLELRPMPDVVTDNAWDVGPYGHHGLYGGAFEWSRYTVKAGAPRGCQGVRDDELYDAAPTGPVQVITLQVAAPLERALLRLNPDRPRHENDVSLELHRATWDAPYWHGFRCAFPLQ